MKIDDSPRISTPQNTKPSVPLVTVKSTKIRQLVRPSPIQIETQAQNVFSGSQELLKQIPQHDKGPKQDSKGQILKHTIVGSVQQFMQEKQRRQQKDKKPQVKLQTQFAPDSELQPANSSYLKLTEHMSSKDLGKKSPGKIKSKDFQLLQMNEMEVQQEILEVERRVKINSLENQKMNDQLKKKLNKGDQLKMDTFFRAITNYEQTLDNWEQTNLKVTSRVSRKQGQSMNEKIEQYRVKEEVKQLLDHITPIEQKLGNDYWKQGLRSTESTLKKKYPYKYIDQLELDPQYRVDQKPPVIEIVRRPNTCTSNYRPYSSFTSRFYLDKKLKENEDLVHKLISPIKEIEQLKLEGQNVLKQEVNSVRNPRDSFVKITSGVANNESTGFNKYIKKIPIKPEQPVPDEILVQNYSKKTLINTGQFGSLKGYF